MKIIKAGYLPVEFTCPCGAVVEFEKDDVEDGEGEADFVRCPSCTRLIPAFILWPAWLEAPQ